MAKLDLKIPTRWRSDEFVACYLKALMKGVGLGYRLRHLTPEQISGYILDKRLHHNKKKIGEILGKEGGDRCGKEIIKELDNLVSDMSCPDCDEAMVIDDYYGKYYCISCEKHFGGENGIRQD